jgi:hypothetical protein
MVEAGCHRFLVMLDAAAFSPRGCVDRSRQTSMVNRHCMKNLKKFTQLRQENKNRREAFLQ